MLGKLLAMGVVATGGLVVMGIALAMVGAVIGLAFAVVALAVKAIPLLLIGLIVTRLVRASERRRFAVYAADQRWLDS
ncbi:MAG TPA: hypothetical protein VF665_16575 [Longimicrobium sp.]|jgi:hypothetical protein|uniref:hypothetical protein n=1 Tax=Longimicrobium sp. TaxID=2029185 RepID=UPI002EDB27F7